MAITRRQFVTRLGALAAAAGFSQAEASKIMDAMAYDTSTAPGSVYQGTFGKPRVVWIHGAECTGCSTSLLGIYENSGAPALFGTTGPSIASALTLSGTIPFTSEGALNTNPTAQTMLHSVGMSPDQAAPASIDIADVVIDVIDLLYHETVMGMGGDLAYQWLNDFQTKNTLPFVLVVEGAMQATANGGAWNDVSTVPWCSIGHHDNPAGPEIVPAEIVATLGEMQACVAIVAIGQCATYGGYPGCRPPIAQAAAGFNPLQSQTDAKGVLAFLSTPATPNAVLKVVNSPGCPTNPWWFILTVVSLLVDIPAVLHQPTGTVGPLGVLKSLSPTPLGTAANGNIGIGKTTTGFDGTARIKAVYNNPIHGPYCPRYRNFVQGVFAAVPGDTGCLQKIGCKGPAAKSLCGVHGWNNQQPSNAGAVGFGTVPNSNLAPDGVTPTGGHCTRAGHPCMACTEQGYPDSFVPFIKRT
jgi:hydrogenase small subunit